MVRISGVPKGLRFAATPDAMPIAEAEALARALARYEPSDDALKLLADHAEVREKWRLPGHDDLGLHRRDVGVEQPVAVLRERRMIPDRAVDAEADEPAEQQIVVDLLHQLPFGTDRVESLQQRRA